MNTGTTKTEVSTPMEEYETTEHKHSENTQCFVAHLEINLDTFNKLSVDEKRHAIRYEVASMGYNLIDHIMKEFGL